MIGIWNITLYTPPRGEERKGWQEIYAVLAHDAEDAVKMLRKHKPDAFAFDPDVEDVEAAAPVVKLSTWRR